MKTIIGYAGRSSSGEVVHESLLVDELSQNLFKLRASPGLVLGLAKDDVFRLDPESKPLIIQRGQNIAIQIYKEGNAKNQHHKIEEAILESLHGATMDGVTESQLVFTVPVSEGFPKIESTLNTAITSCPGYEWYFGNVYDNEDGITPLNWWKSNSG